VDEFEIIRRFFRREPTDDSVPIGVGDDGAILTPDHGRDLVAVVDTMVAAVHFPDFLSPADVGYRAVAVNLSDIAAMGGRPRWMTLALTLDVAEPAWLAAFADGLFAAGDEWKVSLVGGDTTHGSEIVISVQIIGDVDPGGALLRSGAQPGDGIYVTGTPGDAAAGLSLLQSNAPRSEAADYLVRRFCRPTARVGVGQMLAGRARAAIDLSDGLYTDLEKLLTASNVGGIVEFDDIPLSTALAGLMSRQDALRFALSGGDDYELCFTADRAQFGDRDEVAGVPVTRIGEVVQGAGLGCTEGGRQSEYRDTGYRHFT